MNRSFNTIEKLDTSCTLHYNNAITNIHEVEWYFNGSEVAKNEKEYSWHVPAIKFTGMKQLV